MTRKEIEALLISWGWISLGNYVVANGDYVIELETFHVKHGFMVNSVNGNARLWVEEDEVFKHLAVHFFLKYMCIARSERPDIMTARTDIESVILAER